MSPKFGKNCYKSSKTLEDLNDYCLLDIMAKLSLKDKLRFRLNKRFKYLVEKDLSLLKGMKIGKTVGGCCDGRHRSLAVDIVDHQSSDLFTLNDYTKKILSKMFKFCRNIRCIELSAEIDLKLIVWIRRQCQQLECLQINNSMLNNHLSSRQWMQIGETLSDQLIHLSITSTTNLDRMTEFGLMYLIQNLKQLEVFSFDVHETPIDKVSQFFGPTLHTLKLNKCHKYRITQQMLDIIKRNAINLKHLEFEVYNVEPLALIANTFPQLKTLNILFYTPETFMPQSESSFPQLDQMTDLQHLKIDFYQNRAIINNYLTRSCFPKLLSINLTGISFTPNMFDQFDRYLPKLEQLVLNNCSLLCCDTSIDYSSRQDCNECKEKLWTYLSQLKHLRQLSVRLLPRKDTGLSKSYVWTFDDNSYPAIEELDFKWLPYDFSAFVDNLLKPFIRFAGRHPRRLFKLKVNSEYFGYLTKRKKIMGIVYNVIVPLVPRNVKIINCYD